MEIIEGRITKRNDVIRDSGIYANTLQFNCSVLLIGSYARGDFNLLNLVQFRKIKTLTKRFAMFKFPTFSINISKNY